jgi:Flp pilus assembly protein TadG
VEFAVVAPLFLLLLAGIIEFGQAFRIEHAISNASRRGARAGIIDGVTSLEVAQNVKTQCTETLGVDEADVTVEVTVNADSSTDLSQAGGQDEISVTVSIPFSKAGAGFFANMFSTTVLSSTCILEHE